MNSRSGQFRKMLIRSQRVAGLGTAAVLQKIDELGEGGTFTPEEVHILVAAFDAAWASVLSSGAPFAEPAYHERARDTLARSIIQAAKSGERDERKLIDGALLQLSRITLRR